MASVFPILIGAPQTPPKPSKRQLGREAAAARKAAEGHRAAASALARINPDVTTAEASAMAAEHLRIAAEYEKIAKAAEAAALTATR